MCIFPPCLALNPNVIAKGFANNGQDVQEAGQVASLTSTNNFINFCLTVNKPLTNGQQIKGGSCNPAPMGVIAATTNMPSSKFVSPVNGQNIAANTAFNIQMAVNHLETGNFVNAQENYYSAPQQVNQAGDIVGHTHFTVQAIPSFTSTAPLDPNVFAFFKGVNTAAQGGVVSEAVTAGLPAGSYRVCSINTDANHMPCLVAVAQHGSLDDCVYVSSDNSIYFNLSHLFRSSLSVVPLVTTLSRPALRMRLPITLVQELRTRLPPVQLVQLPAMLQLVPVLLRVLQVLQARVPPQVLPVLLQALQARVPPRVLPARVLPQVLQVQLQALQARVPPQVPQARALLQVQARLQARVPPQVLLARVQLQERKRVVVVNPALGVITEMGDVTLRSPDFCLG